VSYGKRLLTLAAAAVLLGPVFGAHAEVRIKDLARLGGAHDDGMLGYGLVVGLGGTGDSPRNQPTVQSVSNMLREFGLQVPVSGISSRNVAAVLVTANLPALVRSGDRLDVNVAAIGDARSLAGGTLLLTPLLDPQRRVCATAQGPLTVGGYRFEQNGNVSQKNFPTSASIPEGAVAECQSDPSLLNEDGTLDLLLNSPDYTTAVRVAATISNAMPEVSAVPVDSGRIRLRAPAAAGALVGLIARLENLTVEPDVKARVVVNERTGTIVSGGNVWISDVTITHGDIKVSITQQYFISQPTGLILEGRNNGIRTAIVPDTEVRVLDPEMQSVSLNDGATVAELVGALQTIRVSAQDVIAILQGIKRSGALHAELIIQ
jgi:flagellar P-ring protein precursor FlgI